MLLQKDVKVLIQGITGKEGQKAAKAMLDYGTNVVGGVRPGKAGQTVEGRPVFDSVKDAIDVLGPIHTSMICVPPQAAKDAILEAIDNGIPHIYVFTERIPIQDTACCLAEAKEKNIQIIGPSSMGYIVPGVGRIGLIGGSAEQLDELYHPGSIGVVSRSGGMTNELCWQIKQAGLGQSMAMHIGGDVLVGTTYADALRMLEQDEKTKAVILFGEHGGRYEFEIVDLIKKKQFTKPLAVCIGGDFTQTLPEGVPIGHAGAIVAKGQGVAEKVAALREVGAMIAERYEDLVELVKPYT